jgi:hypothetical protein
VETFAEAREFVDHPEFGREREATLASLSLAEIDPPLRGIVEGFAGLPHCFTLQSCYGHFVHADQPDRQNVERLPERDTGVILYRIAYLALCVENSAAGVRLCSELARLTAIDPEYVQFGSPEWFWERHPNSFALQVEPQRFVDRDTATIDHAEALRIQDVRDRCFAALAAVPRF